MTTGNREEFLAFGRPSFGPDEIAAVARVMRTGWVGMGQETIAFESELAQYLGAPHVVSVNSCTSALHLSLLVSGVEPGDEVICPSLTWCSTANAVLYVGARPVFCDVDAHSLCVSPETVAPHLTPRTKAVMVVHFGGLAVDVTALRKTLPPHIAIIEDAAHAIGATYPDGTRVGSSGNPTCFSFYANKNLSTGEGGAIALFDPQRADRARSLRQHGLSNDAWKRYTHPQTALAVRIRELGYKMNYNDLQASIGRVQLRRQPELAARRMALARRYVARLDSTGVPLTFQHNVLDEGHARHLLVVSFPISEMRSSRNDILLALRNRNIGASLHYPPLHAMPAYRRAGAPPLPTTETLANRIVTLPIGADMTADDVDYVADHLRALLAADVAARMAS